MENERFDVIMRLLHRQGWLATEYNTTVRLSFRDASIGETIEKTESINGIDTMSYFLSNADEYDRIVLRIFYYAHDRSLLALNKGSQESHTLLRTFVSLIYP